MKSAIHSQHFTTKRLAWEVKCRNLSRRAHKHAKNTEPSVITIPHRERAPDSTSKLSAWQWLMMNTQMKSKETAIQAYTLKRPLPVFNTEIKDASLCLAVANVRLSTHTYIHKCVHRQAHLSCKCSIIKVLSEEGKLGCLLKIAILKRFIDVTLGNGGLWEVQPVSFWSLQNPHVIA